LQAIPVEIQWLLGLSQTAQTWPAGYAAFVSPDVGPSLHELINVELQRLRRFQISAIKIDIVSKVVQRGTQCLLGSGKPCEEKSPIRLVVP